MSERKKTLNKHANGHSTFEMGITELLRAMENEGERDDRERNDLARLRLARKSVRSERHAGSEPNMSIRRLPQAMITQNKRLLAYQIFFHLAGPFLGSISGPLLLNLKLRQTCVLFKKSFSGPLLS